MSSIASKKTSSYASLGIRPVINANATLTKLGGSLMSTEAREAMQAAAHQHVDLHELQQKVGERIASLSNNEAAYVSTGAAAGLLLATAACITGADESSKYVFPNLDGLKNEVIIQKMHRNTYDYAIIEIGAKLVEIGTDDGTSSDDLQEAITDKTAAIFWFQGIMNQPSELPLATVIEIANKSNVPVIVDAAAQLPPVSNLWKYTEMGASLAVFSGGKDLAGPQASGLVLGKKELIDVIRMHGAPNHSVGRPMKVGKEEMMGLLAAVERYLSLDHSARSALFEERVSFWNNGLNQIAGITAERDFPNEAGQPEPRTIVHFGNNFTKDDIVNKLFEGEPCISVAASETTNAILLNPMTVQEGEAEIVLTRLTELLT